MKIVGVPSLALLSLLLATVAPAYSQQERREERKDHPEQQRGQQDHSNSEPQRHQPPQEQKQQRTQQVQRQEHAQQPQRHEPAPSRQAQQRPQERSPQQAQQPHQQVRQSSHRPPERARQQSIRRSAWQQHGSQHWDNDHRDWRQRGGYHGYRIPDQRFRGYFGPSHGFRIHGLPFLVVGGYPRFQYQGYWISTVDPWPAYWGNDWYDNDDVYVNYVDDGYYLYNRRYPTVGIAINISL